VQFAVATIAITAIAALKLVFNIVLLRRSGGSRRTHENGRGAARTYKSPLRWLVLHRRLVTRCEREAANFVVGFLALAC
jgi:hypothetical protein